MSDLRLDADLDLLDRQVLDREGRPVGKVDDIELALESGRMRVTALLLGPQALGGRLGGRLGRWIAAMAQRIGDHDGPIRLPIEDVGAFDVSIELKVPAEEIGRVGDLEDWLRDHFISRIPGARRAAE